MAKTFNSRILLKSDTTANWEKASNVFIPKLGEMCIYTDRFETINDNGETVFIPGMKIGDGVKYINELEFVNDDYISNEEINTILEITDNSFNSQENDLIFGNLTEYSNEITGKLNYKTCLNNPHLTSIYLPNVSLVDLTDDKTINYFSEAASLQKLCLNDNFFADPNTMAAPLFKNKKGVLYTNYYDTSFHLTRDFNKIILQRKPKDFFSDTFSFTLEGREYIAETFMTWEEWCSSSYNTGGYYYDGQFTFQIKRSDGANLIYNYNHNSSTLRFVKPEHLISDGDSYIYAWEEAADNEPM